MKFFKCIDTFVRFLREIAVWKKSHVIGQVAYEKINKEMHHKQYHFNEGKQVYTRNI